MKAVTILDIARAVGLTARQKGIVATALNGEARECFVNTETVVPIDGVDAVLARLIEHDKTDFDPEAAKLQLQEAAVEVASRNFVEMQVGALLKAKGKAEDAERNLGEAGMQVAKLRAQVSELQDVNAELTVQLNRKPETETDIARAMHKSHPLLSFTLLAVVAVQMVHLAVVYAAHSTIEHNIKYAIGAMFAVATESGAYVMMLYGDRRMGYGFIGFTLATGLFFYKPWAQETPDAVVTVALSLLCAFSIWCYTEKFNELKK